MYLGTSRFHLNNSFLVKYLLQSTCLERIWFWHFFLFALFCFYLHLKKIRFTDDSFPYFNFNSIDRFKIVFLTCDIFFKNLQDSGLAPGLVSHTAEFPTPPANVEAPFNYGNLEKAVNKAASSNISGRYENVALHEEQKLTLVRLDILLIVF